ncbi:MAG: SDR family NAD(P)-dependent oxidoreductase [Alphaproteobacteria bacterium]|nr:SDR family NAD(P)-dependent oxidoreductase [Alphaproteobacteria bacterium SS10]
MTVTHHDQLQSFTGLNSFGESIRVAVFGASGGIGNGFVEHLASDPSVSEVFAFSRSGTAATNSKVTTGLFDLTDEASIADAAKMIGDGGALTLVICAVGMLHDQDGAVAPEKSWRDLSADGLARAYQINALGPALLMKHLLPLLPRDGKAGFAALSARVGSVSDNRIGGWYGYRAAKAALNQHIRCAAIELARKHKQAFCIGLHPGTVDTGLSAPFQKGVPNGKLFTPEQSTGAMLTVVDQLTAEDSGKLFGYDGEEIAP